MRPARHVCFALAFALALVLVGARSAVEAKGSLSTLEDEFERAIKKVTPATVVCLPRGIEERKVFGGSSGVIMSRRGLVLSDGDVGVYNDKPHNRQPTLKHTDEIEVRLPSLKGKGFQSFKARVIRRDKDLDTSLLRIEKPPSTLKPLRAGHSDTLKVGDFAFTMGNSFGLAAEAPPTLTAGVVASLVPNKTTEGGTWGHIYTSAAVNIGVNGGPLVDTRGLLIGTISNVVGFGGKKSTDPELAYAFLGKAVPVDRLRHFYKDLPEAEELFPKATIPKVPTESAALATVFHQTARRTYGSLVSIKVERDEQLSLSEPGRGGMVKIPRYMGPVSGTLLSQDGWILSSLYNFANLATLNPRFAGRWPAPDNAKVKAGLDGIKRVRVYLPDGRKVRAKYISYHEGIGVVLIKARMDSKDDDDGEDSGSTTRATMRIIKPAKKSAFKAGKFVLAVGHPFGAKRLDDPLLTVGILSKRHDDATEAPWGGQWQTDAGATDANAGGAVVDLAGNLLGIMTIWSATSHGRNSGVAFVASWMQIEPVLEDLKKGRSFRRPLMGINWGRDATGAETTTLAVVAEDTAADNAGLRSGDVVVKIDGKPVSSPGEVRRALAGKWAGDRISVTVDRDGEEKTFELILGARD